MDTPCPLKHNDIIIISVLFCGYNKSSSYNEHEQMRRAQNTHEASSKDLGAGSWVEGEEEETEKWPSAFFCSSSRSAVHSLQSERWSKVTIHLAGEQGEQAQVKQPIDRQRLREEAETAAVTTTKRVAGGCKRGTLHHHHPHHQSQQVRFDHWRVYSTSWRSVIGYDECEMLHQELKKKIYIYI